MPYVQAISEFVVGDVPSLRVCEQCLDEFEVVHLKKIVQKYAFRSQ